MRRTSPGIRLHRAYAYWQCAMEEPDAFRAKNLVARSLAEARGNLKESYRVFAKLGEITNETERIAALRQFQENVDQKVSRREFIHTDTDWAALRLLGIDRQDLRNLGDIGLEEVPRFRIPLFQAFLPVFEYMAADVADIDQVVRRCGDSKRTLAGAYFVVATDELAKGHRSQALEYFQKCVDQDVYDLNVHHWSFAFIEKLKADSDWLPWLAARPALVGVLPSERQ